MTTLRPLPALGACLVLTALIPELAAAQHKPATGPAATTAAARFAICIGVGPGAMYVSHPVPVKNQDTRQEFTAYLMKSYGTNSTRPMNDMWLACAKMLDVPVTTLGTDDMRTTPLDINIV